MKICFWASASFEAPYSSYHLMRDLLRAFTDAGHEVWLVQPRCADGALPPALQDIPGLHVCNVADKRVGKANLAKRYAAQIRYFLRSARVVRQLRGIDAIFLQSNNAPFLPAHYAGRHGIPLIYNVQDIFPQNAAYSGTLRETALSYRCFRILQKYTFARCRKIVTISGDMRRTLIDAGADPTRVTVIHNWANAAPDAAAQPRPHDGTCHVVYAGNIGRMQNVELLLRAAKLLSDRSDICFDIYGDGPRRAQCMALAEGLANVRFFDPLPPDEAYTLYRDADINVVPLAKGIIRTALPSKTAACLRSGRRVIFCVDTDSAFAAAVKAQSDFQVVSPDSAEDLAAAILQEKDNGDTTCAPLVSEFEKDRALQAWCEILDEI